MDTWWYLLTTTECQVPRVNSLKYWRRKNSPFIPSIQTNLYWENGEDPTAQVVLQSQSFIHHLELKAIITIIKFMNGITIKDRKSPEADDEIKMIPWEEKVRKLSCSEVRVT